MTHKIKDKKALKCVHIADIHFRGLSRHKEYRESFYKFFKKVEELAPDVIYVGGDIVHSKTQGISPELIDILSWWFTSLSNLAPTHIILGNHDGLMLNKDRQDAITPIINALDNDNLYLYKESGVYPTGVDGYNWCVFSCFDEGGWKDVEPVDGEVNIALFHGGVHGSTTDINWNIDGEVGVEFFEGYDFVFLGDIHRQQYLDKEKRIAYCGSTIQQNYGEDEGKGFLFWEIESKDKFTSKFYPVPHSKPFVTIDWMGDVSSTLDEAEAYPDGSRFRVRTSSTLSQAEIKHTHTSLKEFKGAAEIVWKHDSETDMSIIQTGSEELFKEDLRDPKTLVSLMRKFYSDIKITDEEWKSLEELTTKYLTGISQQQEVVRNVKWSIKRMWFDNTFSYGKGNYIDFDDLTGIIGIFGRNRSGKSSIPGTIMYGLYNTTDRGPIKNLHIINSRKGHCFTKIDISVNGKNYRVERQSVKHENRKKQLNATTHLNLYLLDEDGNEIQDLSGEQRRETEKIVRKLVGSSDDFLLTSLASQGEMNAFIKERATKRKEILTNFLDLAIFDQMMTLAKEESSEIKALLKNSPDREWDVTIDEMVRARKVRIRERDKLDADLSKLRLKLQDLKIILATHKDKNIVTTEDVSDKQQYLDSLTIDNKEKKACLLETDRDIKLLEEKITRIEIIKSQFPIDELKVQLESQKSIKEVLSDLERSLDREKMILQSHKKSIKKLEEVPCGDQFPTCKYIKESHRNKKLLSDQENRVDDLKIQTKAAKKSLSGFQKENFHEKIQRYEQILSQESDIKVQISKHQLLVHETKTAISALTTGMEVSERELTEMKLNVSDSEIASEVRSLKQKLNQMSEQIGKMDSKRMSFSEQIGKLKSEIKTLRFEYKKHKELLTSWRIYDLFTTAVSKKGIPLQIITSQLPAINTEISKILRDVVGFTVELDATSSSNAMDIYINYGDSRRVIECASGMEKMVSSLAIRVALSNVSSLPKTDILVIDEGFGALDEMNVESCNKLLESLKKWYKNILVISHVDAVKDAVDIILDITRSGKDSHVNTKKQKNIN
jgi:DNA repair exonuclease SbcCD ATPase subunit